MGLNRNRLNLLQNKFQISEEAIEKIFGALNVISSELSEEGVQHKMLGEEEGEKKEDSAELEYKMDESDLAQLVLETMVEEFDADEVPDFAPALADAIAKNLAEYIGMMAEQRMTESMADDERKGLDSFRLEYEQREKMVGILQQLVDDTASDADAIDEISKSLGDLNDAIAKFLNFIFVMPQI